VARWVEDVADRHPAVDAGGATIDVVDLADFDLPLLDEPVPAFFGAYRNPHTKRWADTVAGYDGFVFVIPEYNHSLPAALYSLDYLYAEWNDKAAGFVSYGVNGGVRAVEHLRLVLAEVKVANVRSQVALSVLTDFEPSDPTDPDAPRLLRPREDHEADVTTMLDELIALAQALASLRDAAPAEAALQDA
jgi:NAD(P)H-dependent FMN reductase